DIMDQQFYSRDSLLAGLSSRDQWARHLEVITDSLKTWTGPFPNRTPLNARITGRIERDDYIIENVLFESRPGFFVSANLYVPSDGDPPYPAVLNVIGHSAEGKSAYYVQERCINQAKKGLVALAIDGLGQGERQIADYSTYGSLPGGVHKGIGFRTYLLGWHVFNIMAWDAIRAIDYLATRPEVDLNHLAVTGASGGGQMSTYLLPLENRITVAVPTDNPVEFSYHAHIPIGTDHEQAFYGAFAAGIDMRGDLLFPHVPDPLLINASANDVLNPPRGVWALARHLDRLYAAYDAPEKFKVFMSDSDHGYRDQSQREAASAWMLRWMDGDAENYREEPVHLEEAEALWCTREGNVYRLPGSREPQDLVVEYLGSHVPTAHPIGNSDELTIHAEKIRVQARRLLRLPAKEHSSISEKVEIYPLEDRRLVQLVLRPEEGIRLPAVLLEPILAQQTNIWQRLDRETGVWEEWTEEIQAGPVVLYVSDSGKQDLLQETAIVDSLLAAGVRLLAVDLRGVGETAPGMESSLLDYLVGRPVFGQRVGDILAWVDWLTRRRMHTSELYIWARGITGLHAGFAAALNDRISGLILEEPVLSFESVVRARTGPYREELLLPGVLKVLDMGQIYQAIAPRPITLITPRNGHGEPASEAEIRGAYGMTAGTYQTLFGGSGWQVYPEVTESGRLSAVLALVNGR
ncbi:MAG TPA: acetylxylan esterase, partial [bacterium]|nr:acetylxylan esterase [bacterium]